MSRVRFENATFRANDHVILTSITFATMDAIDADIRFYDRFMRIALLPDRMRSGI